MKLTLLPWKRLYEASKPMDLFGDQVRRSSGSFVLYARLCSGQHIPVAYGVKKLRIGCVVEDDKVISAPYRSRTTLLGFLVQIGTDFLDEKICEFEDFVQSVDVFSFNKV